MKTTTFNADLVNYAINGLVNITPDKTYGCNLHNELFNTDYFIIGSYKAEEWLKENVGIFTAIDEIKDYEQFNFGKVNTDLSSAEKVVNMYAYIKGEEILAESKTLQEKWDDTLTEDDINNIKRELEELV